MGNDYRGNAYYGGYPPSYLKRLRAVFPDKRHALHLFAGKVDVEAFPGDTIDINPALQPTFVADAHDLGNLPMESYDLVLADPPYSAEDAVKYGTKMIDRRRVMSVLGERLQPGAHLVWLDQMLPMYRKDAFAIEAMIGISVSTNHRFRIASIFRRVGAGPEQAAERRQAREQGFCRCLPPLPRESNSRQAPVT
jgi:hypothetical protein